MPRSTTDQADLGTRDGPCPSIPSLVVPILAAVVLTLLPRIAWALAVPFQPVSDSGAYFNFAVNISSGFGYGWQPHEPTAYWAVGPSAIYAAAFVLLGATKLAVVLVNLLAAVLCSVCAVVLAARWFGRPHAWVAGFLFAAWPTMVMFTTVLNSEQMFAAILLLTLVVTDPMRAPSWKRSALVAPLVAAMALVRPTGLLIPAAVAGTRFLRGKGFVRPVAAGLLTTALMLVCIAPWTYRNYTVFGEPVLISTNGGPNFWMGNNPETNGRYTKLPDDAAKLKETERARVLKQRALDHIKAEPVAFAKRTAEKMVLQHTTETIGVVWNEPALTDRYGDRLIRLGGREIDPLKIITTGFWGLTLLGALAGVVMLIRTAGLWRTITHPCVVLWGYFASVHAITVIQDRYHLQWSPMIMLLATIPLAAILARVGPFKTATNADTPDAEPAAAPDDAPQPA